MRGGPLEKGCVLCYAKAPAVANVSFIAVIIKYFLFMHFLTGLVEGSGQPRRPGCRAPRMVKAGERRRPPWPGSAAGLLNSVGILLGNRKLSFLILFQRDNFKAAWLELFVRI
jgi:hypothetical protein